MDLKVDDTYNSTYVLCIPYMWGWGLGFAILPVVAMYRHDFSGCPSLAMIDADTWFHAEIFGGRGGAKFGIFAFELRLVL